MKRALLALLLLLPLAGCSRHFVVERNLGQVDGAKSISTTSDEEWTIGSEPRGGG